MGKAGRWLRHFLPGGRRDRGKDKPLAPAPEPLVLTATTTPASTPGAKEKRRWSFRRPAATAFAFPAEPRVDPDQHAVAVAIATAAAAEAAMVARHAAVQMSASAPGSKRAVVVGIEDAAAAAIKIQAVFRSYLARKALCALRGLVKLQALVRGHLVRRQASHTLRCMQALVAAQHRARVARLRLLGDDDNSNNKPAGALRTPRTTTPTRRSPHHPRSRHHHPQTESSAEENVKIVEVDTGFGVIGGEAQAHATPRTAASRRSSCYATPLCRTPSKQELYGQKVSPTPSALTDASARSLSGRYDYDFSFATARNSPYHYADYYASRQQQRHHHAGVGTEHPLLAVPSYMANTQSSRAKARSQSAPRQRHSVSSAGAVAAEVPPWERQGSSARRRASLEGQSPAPAARRVQRCPSQASAPSCPWGARLDRLWSASAHDSECGSTSTVLTAATTTYCWSMATDNAGMA